MPRCHFTFRNQRQDATQLQHRERASLETTTAIERLAYMQPLHVHAWPTNHTMVSLHTQTPSTFKTIRILFVIVFESSDHAVLGSRHHATVAPMVHGIPGFLCSSGPLVERLHVRGCKQAVLKSTTSSGDSVNDPLSPPTSSLGITRFML